MSKTVSSFDIFKRVSTCAFGRSNFKLTPCLRALVIAPTSWPTPELSTYVTPARFSRIFFCPFLANSRTVSLRTTPLPGPKATASPRLKRPAKSRMVTSSLWRVAHCIVIVIPPLHLLKAHSVLSGFGPLARAHPMLPPPWTQRICHQCKAHEWERFEQEVNIRRPALQIPAFPSRSSAFVLEACVAPFIRWPLSCNFHLEIISRQGFGPVFTSACQRERA